MKKMLMILLAMFAIGCNNDPEYDVDEVLRGYNKRFLDLEKEVNDLKVNEYRRSYWGEYDSRDCKKYAKYNNALFATVKVSVIGSFGEAVGAVCVMVYKDFDKEVDMKHVKAFMRGVECAEKCVEEQ